MRAAREHDREHVLDTLITCDARSREDFARKLVGDDVAIPDSRQLSAGASVTR